MEEPEIDIYGDLEEYDLGERLKTLECANNELVTKNTHLELIVADLKKQNEILVKAKKDLEKNASSLLKTAQSEMKRKDIRLATLQKEYDSLIFRRNGHKHNRHVPNIRQQNESSYIPPNQINNAVLQIKSEPNDSLPSKLGRSQTDHYQHEIKYDTAVTKVDNAGSVKNEEQDERRQMNVVVNKNRTTDKVRKQSTDEFSCYQSDIIKENLTKEINKCYEAIQEINQNNQAEFNYPLEMPDKSHDAHRKDKRHYPKIRNSDYPTAHEKQPTKEHKKISSRKSSITSDVLQKLEKGVTNAAHKEDSNTSHNMKNNSSDITKNTETVRRSTRISSTKVYTEMSGSDEDTVLIKGNEILPKKERTMKSKKTSVSSLVNKKNEMSTLHEEIEEHFQEINVKPIVVDNVLNKEDIECKRKLVCQLIKLREVDLGLCRKRTEKSVDISAVVNKENKLGVVKCETQMATKNKPERVLSTKSKEKVVLQNQKSESETEENLVSLDKLSPDNDNRKAEMKMECFNKIPISHVNTTINKLFKDKDVPERFQDDSTKISKSSANDEINTNTLDMIKSEPSKDNKVPKMECCEVKVVDKIPKHSKFDKTNMCSTSLEEKTNQISLGLITDGSYKENKVQNIDYKLTKGNEIPKPDKNNITQVKEMCKVDNRNALPFAHTTLDAYITSEIPINELETFGNKIPNCSNISDKHYDDTNKNNLSEEPNGRLPYKIPKLSKVDSIKRCRTIADENVDNKRMKLHENISYDHDGNNDNKRRDLAGPVNDRLPSFATSPKDEVVIQIRRRKLGNGTNDTKSRYAKVIIKQESEKDEKSLSSEVASSKTNTQTSNNKKGHTNYNEKYDAELRRKHLNLFGDERYDYQKEREKQHEKYYSRKYENKSQNYERNKHNEDYLWQNEDKGRRRSDHIRSGDNKYTESRRRDYKTSNYEKESRYKNRHSVSSRSRSKSPMWDKYKNVALDLRLKLKKNRTGGSTTARSTTSPVHEGDKTDANADCKAVGKHYSYGKTSDHDQIKISSSPSDAVKVVSIFINKDHDIKPQTQVVQSCSTASNIVCNDNIPKTNKGNSEVRSEKTKYDEDQNGQNVNHNSTEEIRTFQEMEGMKPEQPKDQDQTTKDKYQTKSSDQAVMCSNILQNRTNNIGIEQINEEKHSMKQDDFNVFKHKDQVELYNKEFENNVSNYDSKSNSKILLHNSMYEMTMEDTNTPVVMVRRRKINVCKK